MKARALAERKALVTGAARGIGRATAERFAEEGAWVACADIDEEGAQETANTIHQRTGKAIALKLDVTDAAAVSAAIDQTDAAFGGFDILFNNAGIAGGDWHQTIAVNLTGVYNGLAHGAAKMSQNERGGAIVNTASIAGLVGLVGPNVGNAAIAPEAFSGAAGYIASKHGVAGLTKQFALAFAARGVRVNAIAPGYIVTNMTDAVRQSQEYNDYILNLHPMGRMGETEEIAAVAAFLASDDASFITGIVLPVDGGYTSR